MSKIKVSLDNQCFMTKPDPIAASRISNRIGRLAKELNPANIQSFACDIGLNGQTFCPATFKNGKRSKENFEQQQLFALDFDGGISFETVKKRAEDYSLPILFAYDTFSSRNHDKFRVVFLNDVSITNRKVAEAMSMGLGAIFPEADSSCYRDVSKMYYGGFTNEILYFYDVDDGTPIINAESLFRNFALCLHDRYGKNHYKTHIKKFSNTTGLPLTDKNLPDFSSILKAEFIGTTQNGNFSTNSIKENINIVGKFPNSDNSNNVECTNSFGNENIPPIYRSRDIGDIRSCCRLFREFEDGSRRFSHNERFGLATNLIHIYSGAKLFKNILRSNKCFDDRPKRYSEWDYYLRYMTQQKNNYKPKACDTYCPFAHECQHSANILTTAKPKNVERIETYSYVSSDVSEKQFKHIFWEYVNAKGFGWYIIKCQTAIGKTLEVLKFLKNTQLRVLLVVPTNVLKRDVRRRAKKMGIEIVVSPSLHELEDQLPVDVWSEIKLRYETGKSPMSYIKKHIAEDNPECAALFKKHLRKLEKFNDAPGHAIATHRRLTHMDTSKYDLVIVDEDIILSTILTNREAITIKTLKKLKKQLTASDPLAAKIGEIIKYFKTGIDCFTLAEVKYIRKDYAGIKMAVNIPALCAATHFCALKVSDEDNELDSDSVVFQIPNKFQENTKYIMLSATANKTICEHVFGADNVRFHECDLAELEGALYQDCSRSMSRGNIAGDASIYDQIMKTTGVDEIISFKKFLEKGLYNGELTFSNCAGVDTLCGKDINVVGTPHQTDWIYKLFAYAHGFDVDTDAKLKHHTPVVHNGFRFRFTTYDDELLRAIQFYIIESDLEQAVGRARLLRKKCKVYLFSNFPLRQAKIKGLDYDDAIAK